jgi:glutamate synthase (NADPH/NADH) large chain
MRSLKYKGDGLPRDTIHLNLANEPQEPRNFGAFNKGITLELEGDANDYFGKVKQTKWCIYPSRMLLLFRKKI